MSISDFETLQIAEFINVETFGWQPPVLTADFGGGYGAGAITAPYGLRSWSLSANLIPDLEEYSVDYSFDGDDYTDSRFEYFFQFYQRHLLRGNKPFIMRDPRTKKDFLVAFVDPQAGITFQQFTSKLFAGGVGVSERRVSGITFNADGSIDRDYTPPVISSLTISGSAPYTGTRTLTCSVSDNVAVTKVEFYIDYELLSTDTVSAYTASWNTRLYKNGARKVKAIAYDAMGNKSETVLTVILANDFTPPTIEFIAPANGAVVAGTIDLQVNAVDETSLDRVEFYFYDGENFTYIGDGNSGTAYSYEYDTTALVNDSYTFAAIAFDDAGNQSEAALLEVTVENPFLPELLDHLYFYAEADKLTGFADGDPVGTVEDFSGNNFDAESSSTERPLYKSGANGLNGLPVLQYDGTNDRSYDAGDSSTAAQYTLAFVYKDFNISVVDDFSGILEANGNEIFQYKAANTFLFGMAGFGWTTSTFTMPQAAAAVIVEINTATQNVKIYVNGSMVYNGALGASMTNPATLNAIILGSYSGATFAPMKIALAFITKDHLTADEKSHFFATYGVKYGVSTPVTDAGSAVTEEGNTVTG